MKLYKTNELPEYVRALVAPEMPSSGDAAGGDTCSGQTDDRAADGGASSALTVADQNQVTNAELIPAAAGPSKCASEPVAAEPPGETDATDAPPRRNVSTHLP